MDLRRFPRFLERDHCGPERSLLRLRLRSLSLLRRYPTNVTFVYTTSNPMRS